MWIVILQVFVSVTLVNLTYISCPKIYLSNQIMIQMVQNVWGQLQCNFHTFYSKVNHLNAINLYLLLVLVTCVTVNVTGITHVFSKFQIHIWKFYNELFSLFTEWCSYGSSLSMLNTNIVEWILNSGCYVTKVGLSNGDLVICKL